MEFSKSDMLNAKGNALTSFANGVYKSVAEAEAKLDNLELVKDTKNMFFKELGTDSLGQPVYIRVEFTVTGIEPAKRVRKSSSKAKVVDVPTLEV